ncbi:MAG: hypothetical protein V4654_08635 [Bdellovibrionota bacterium]
MSKFSNILILTLSLINLFSCQKAEDELASFLASDSDNSVLYISTGVCNSGQGMITYTSATATRTIESFSTSNGASQGQLFDYSSAISGMPALMSPVSLYNSGDYLYTLNDGGSGQRTLIKIPKSDPYSYTTIIANNSAAFTGRLWSFTIDDEGSFLISKSTGIEKFNSIASRLTASGSAWINAPAGNCGTATTSMTSVITLPTSSGVTGHVMFAHQGATSATNRIGIVYGGTGYINTSNCLAGAQISAVTHTKAPNLASGTVAFNATGTSPSAMVFVPYSSGTVVGKLLVSYSNGQTYNSVSGTATTLNHGIVAWDVSRSSPSAAALSNPVVLVEDHNKVYAVSAMTYDSTTSSLYIAVGGSLGSANQSGSGYNIEKYTLDLTNAATTGPTLIRASSAPFILGGSNTKCISGLAIGQ